MESKELRAACLALCLGVYTIVVVILGGIDTLTNDGTDRVIQTPSDLLTVTIPIVIVLFVVLISFLRKKSNGDD